MKEFTSKWIRGNMLGCGKIHTKTTNHRTVFSPSQLHVDSVNVQTVQDVQPQ